MIVAFFGNVFLKSQLFAAFQKQAFSWPAELVGQFYLAPDVT